LRPGGITEAEWKVREEQSEQVVAGSSS
jgi:hypothetical protein